MRITNLNPDTAIGASAWLVQMDEDRILLDAGVHPKREGREGLPLYDRIKGQEVDAIAISHCHHDHVGSLPVALRYFPHADVLMTELSYFLVERVLHNSVNVMTRQREEIGEMSYPLFTHRETDRASERWRWCPLRQRISIAGERASQREKDALTFEFFEAGHVLGSAGILLREEGRRPGKILVDGRRDSLRLCR